MKRITVVGSVNLDLVAHGERLPRPGETVTGATFSRVPGGKGANQAVACARLGAEVTFIGAVGRDSFAEEALGGLQGADVNLDLRAVDEPTGVALILVDGSGENQIVVAPGANSTLGEVELPAHDAVLCQLEIPDRAVVSSWEGCTGLFCLNAAPSRPIAVDADVTVVNRYELESLARRDGLIAVTLGAEGAMLLEDGAEIARAVPPAIDAVTEPRQATHSRHACSYRCSRSAPRRTRLSEPVRPARWLRPGSERSPRCRPRLRSTRSSSSLRPPEVEPRDLLGPVPFGHHPGWEDLASKSATSRFGATIR